MHEIFIELLNTYQVAEALKAALYEKMEYKWQEINKESLELEHSFKKQLVEVSGKIENIEESYYVTKDMNKETYDKFYGRFNSEQQVINKQLSQLSSGISNPMATLEGAIALSIGLATEWVSSDIDRKEKLQKLVFPEGISYDKKKEAFRTERVNSIFELIASQTHDTGINEKRQTGVNSCLSPSVRQRRFELPCPLQALPPQSSASTNFATAALRDAKVKRKSRKP